SLSYSGTVGLAASASTRALNSSQLSSRLMYSLGSSRRFAAGKTGVSVGTLMRRSADESESVMVRGQVGAHEARAAVEGGLSVVGGHGRIVMYTSGYLTAQYLENRRPGAVRDDPARGHCSANGWYTTVREDGVLRGQTPTRDAHESVRT